LGHVAQQHTLGG